MSSTDPFSRPEDPIQARTDALASSPSSPPTPLPPPEARASILAFPLHPDFWWGVLWCVGLLLFTQIPGAIVSIVIIVVAAIVSPSLFGELRDSKTLLEHPIGQISIGAALLVAHGLIILFSLALLRILAGRDWRRQVALRLPAFAHVGLVLVVAPAVWLLADGVYAAFGTKNFYVPSIGSDLTGATAFLLLLAAGVFLLWVGHLLLHLFRIQIRLPFAGQIALALLLAAAVRFPAVWAYEALSTFFGGTALATVELSGMQQMEGVFARWPLPIAIFAIGVMPGLSEELWCRAFLGRGLVGKHGLFWGVLGASFLFGTIHVEPRQGAMAMIVGVMLHYVYLTTRSLLLPMLLHFLNNSMSMVILHVPALAQLDEQIAQVSWAVFAGAGLLLAAVVWALYESRARLVAEDGRLPWQPPYPGVACPPPDSGTRIATPLPSVLSMALVGVGAAACAAGFAMALAR